ncbi:MAG TPA: CCA tRNA nucleotidyltransferase [Treponemataceae bacterium]|nr:CCA tRNA nucleotidyltransferase [Treponemataceae bacterium]
MDRIPVPAVLKDLSRIFTAQGYQVYLVGGAVRDYFLGKKAEDWDIATDAKAEEVATLFKRIIPTGIEHGTVTIPFRGHMIECTTFRIETGYTDSRHPDSVSFTATITEDLSRRDFTMNAIAAALPTGEIVDPFDGRKDITKRIIRTVGDPHTRFSEDGLRPLRAIRFSAQTGFTIEGPTLEAISPSIPIIKTVARERIRDELSKLLTSDNPLPALYYLEQTGLLEHLIGELSMCRGVFQGGRHRHDVLDHLFYTCVYCPSASLELRLAGLFHDIGKPVALAFDTEGNPTFHGHETVSASITEKIMTRLKFPGKTIKAVCHLIRQHMFHYESVWTDAAVRRFIVRTGEDEIEQLFALRRADSRAISDIAEEGADIQELRERIIGILKQGHAFTLKDLAINGHDLTSQGVPRGPVTGVILEELMQAVLDDPSLNNRERLLDISRAMCIERKLI